MRSGEADPEVLGLVESHSAAAVHGLPAFALALNGAGVDLGLRSGIATLIDVEGIVHGADSVETDALQILATIHELGGIHGCPGAGGTTVEAETGGSGVVGEILAVAHGVVPVPFEDGDILGHGGGASGVGHGDRNGVGAGGVPGGVDALGGGSGGVGALDGPGDVGHLVNADDVDGERNRGALQSHGGSVDAHNGGHIWHGHLGQGSLDSSDGLVGVIGTKTPVGAVHVAPVAGRSYQYNGGVTGDVFTNPQSPIPII